MLLLIPSYQVYHNLIANDMEIKTNSSHQTWWRLQIVTIHFTYKDGNITRVEQVTQVYDGTPIFSTVEIEKPNPDIE